MLEFGNGIEQRSADHIETFLILKKTESGEGSGIADLAKSPNGSSANTMIWIGEQIEQALMDLFGQGRVLLLPELQAERGKAADGGEADRERLTVSDVTESRIDSASIAGVVEAVKDRGGDHLLPGTDLDGPQENLAGLTG